MENVFAFQRFALGSSYNMWRQGSKPVACRFLVIELEAEIGERGQTYRIFFNSAVACKFAIICKVVIRFWCRLLYLIQNIARYCLEKLQHNQVMDYEDFDDTNFLKIFIRFSHSILMKESNEHNFS